MKKSEVKNYKIENGNWEYSGKIYKHKSNVNDLNKKIRIFSVNTILILLLSIILGFYNVQATRVIYISLPMVLQYFPILFSIIAMYKIINYSNNDLAVSMYRQSYQRFRASSFILILFTITCIIGLLYYSVNNNSISENKYFIIIEILILSLTVYNIKLEQSIEFDEYTGIMKGKL